MRARWARQRTTLKTLPETTAGNHNSHRSGAGETVAFETALAKLPLTRDVINHLIESGVDFAVRRVHAAAARLRRTEGSFQCWQLVRAAGLHYRLEHDLRVKQALDYEVRPPVNVIVYSNAKQIPQGKLQPSTRLPCGDRPVGIVA